MLNTHLWRKNMQIGVYFHYWFYKRYQWCIYKYEFINILYIGSIFQFYSSCM